MSATLWFVSFSDLRQRNRGAYTSPFSGVGTEFYPLGVMPDHSGFVLHETGYIGRNDWWNFPNVLSPFWRLMYNFKKGHKVVFPNAETELTPEQIMLIPDHQLFHCAGNVGVPTFWLAFSVARRLDTRQPIPILLRPSRMELDLIQDIIACYTPDGKCENRTRSFHLSLALLHVTLNRPEVRWQETEAPSIAKVIRHIEQQFGSALTIPELSRLAGMCTASFSRTFKRYQGVTPTQFIVQVRVREAANMLANSASTIDDIAEKTGFPNRAYFSRIFKKVTSESPAHFRRIHTPKAGP